PTSYIIAVAVVLLVAVLVTFLQRRRSTGTGSGSHPDRGGSEGGPMFGNNKKTQAITAPIVNAKPETVIGANTTFVGTIKTDGNVRIDGTLEGDIEILGNLIIGETGRVIATIKAQNVHVSGAVKGEITAVEQLEISPTGKVWGD